MNNIHIATVGLMLRQETDSLALTHTLADWWKLDIPWYRRIAEDALGLIPEQGPKELNKLLLVSLVCNGLRLIMQNVHQQIGNDKDLLDDACLDLASMFVEMWNAEAIDADGITVQDLAETIAVDALASSNFNVTALSYLCGRYNVPLEMLGSYVLGLNSLPGFQNKFGKKEGLYLSTWDGLLDASRVIKILDEGVSLGNLYNVMEDRYRTFLSTQKEVKHVQTKLE